MDGRLAALVESQGRDGGWGYRRGATSWTEPTALALLALQRERNAREAAARARDWLLRRQRADGGWPPRPEVDQSTWVTSLAVMALASDRSDQRGECVARGVEWLLQQTGQRPSSLERFRAWILQQREDSAPTGWPWYPGTASWVVPTAMAILALEKCRGLAPNAANRINQGRAFLLARQCAGGGWNHGGTPVRSEEAAPYPETTGIALLALGKAADAHIAPSLDCAKRMLHAPGSGESGSWLRLGLASRGAGLPDTTPVPFPGYRSTPALALEIAADLPENPFLT